MSPCSVSSGSCLAWGLGLLVSLWEELQTIVPSHCVRGWRPRFQFHNIFANTRCFPVWGFCVFNSCPGGCEMASHGGFGLPFPTTSNTEHLLTGHWPSCVFSGEMSVQVPGPLSWRVSWACLNRDMCRPWSESTITFLKKPRFCFIQRFMEEQSDQEPALVVSTALGRGAPRQG